MIVKEECRNKDYGKLICSSLIKYASYKNNTEFSGLCPASAVCLKINP